MNPFNSDKAPYAIALLISAVGWLLATLHGSVQGSEIIAYKTAVRGEQIVLRVTNLSKVKTIDDVSLGLLCDGGAKCLRPTGPAGDVARARRVPPVAAPVEFIAPSPTEASFITSLSPGASVEIVASLETGGKPPGFYLLPTAENKARTIYVVESHNPFAWFVAHYYLLMTAISLSLAAAFMAWLVVNLLTFLRPLPKDTEDEIPRPAALPAGDAGARPATGARPA